MYVDDCVHSAKMKLERSIATNKNLKKGTIITDADIHLLSPGDGFKWSERESVVGHIVNRDILANEIIYKEFLL